MERVESGRFRLYELRPWEKAEKILPEYNKAQFKDLEKFVVGGGQMSPIVINEERWIIDGYNRWRLANQMGLDEVECDVYRYEDVKEMEMHAIVLNSKRRHLSNLQVARAALRLTEIYKEEEVEANPEVLEEVAVEEEALEAVTEEVTTEELPVEGGEIIVAESALETLEGGEDVETVADVVEEVPVEIVEPLPAVPKKVEEKAIKKATKQLRISRKTVEQVGKVDQSSDPVLIEAMEQKRVSLKVAAELADMPEDQRHDELAKIEQEKMEQDDGNAKAMINACSTCVSRLRSSTKKLVPEAISEEKKAEIREAIEEVIREADSLLSFLDQEFTPSEEGEGSEEPAIDSGVDENGEPVGESVEDTDSSEVIEDAE